MESLVKTELGFGNLEIQNRPIPSPGNNQVKIEVKYAGICGSDIHTYEGHYKVAVPVTLGHEFSGVITEVGEGVNGFQIGDRVTSETTFSICGVCKYCQNGDYNLCNHRKGLGSQQDGGFAKYLIARADSLHHLPANVDFKAGAMTEPLACTHHAIEKVDIKANDVVVVFGPGPIGQFAAQVAKSRGAIVVVTGLTNDKVRLDKSKEVGIDYIVNIQEESLETLIDNITGGYGADVILECSGAVPAARQGLNLLRKKGQYAQIGIFAESEISFNLEDIIQKEIIVVGSRSQRPADWEPSLQLMNEGKVNANALVTHVFDITQWREAYDAIKSGEAIKVLLKPTDN